MDLVLDEKTKVEIKKNAIYGIIMASFMLAVLIIVPIVMVYILKTFIV